MKQKWITVLLILALGVGFWSWLPAREVLAAGTIQYYPSSVAKDVTFSGTTLTAGTPFAVYGQITGAPANTSCTGPKLRLMSASSGGSADSSFRTWAGASGWLTDSGAWASFPAIMTDTSGNWSGWGYGGVPTSATNTYLELRINCGGTNYSSTRVLLTLMDMSTTGGWLEETNGTAREGRAVVVKNGTTIVGMYSAEDNGVGEAYSYSSGGYKVAVPNCSGCGYTVETWDLSSPGTAQCKVNTMGTDGCPNNVSAGGLTSMNSCTTPTAVTLRGLTATAPLSPLAAVLPAFGLVAAAGVALYRRRKA